MGLISLTSQPHLQLASYNGYIRTLHCIGLQMITIDSITLHHATLHYVTLHYIALHYITYKPTYVYTYTHTWVM